MYRMVIGLNLYVDFLSSILLCKCVVCFVMYGRLLKYVIGFFLIDNGNFKRLVGFCLVFCLVGCCCLNLVIFILIG